MIDPKLVTPDNGFVLGETIVEYERAGFSPAVSYLNMRILELKDIKSIRPLTGPMAIWNHAPDWADGFIETPDQAHHEWIAKGSKWFDNADCVKRPFWAPKKA